MDNIRRISCYTVYFLSITVLVTLTSITNIYSLQDCGIPKERYDVTSNVQYKLTIYKDHARKLINFSLTIPETTLPILVNIRGYHLRKTVKAQEIVIADITCRNMLVTMLLELVDLKYSKQECRVFPGKYSFNKMPANDIVRYWRFSKSRVGRYLYEVEFATRRGVFLCFGATVDIQ